MPETSEIPWTKKEICENLITFIISMILGTYLLLLKSWLLLGIYWIIWILFIILDRFMICRHCNFISKSCPTICMGKIAGKLYKRSNKNDFTEINIWTFYLDVLFIVLAMLFPVIIYLYFYFLEGLLLIEWFLIIIYFVIGIIALYLHSKSCKKCTIKGCPFH